MRVIRLAYRRTLHEVDNHGWRGTVFRGLGRLFSSTYPEPASRNRIDTSPHPFDLETGADTGGYTPGECLGAPPESASGLYNTAYYGISPSTLRAALRHFQGAPEDFTFVDLGCGKGRALFVAAELPFRQLLGVELDADLCEVARANFAASTHAAERIRVVHQDALSMRYPETPLLIYLYHPFLAPLLRRVLSSIERQYRSGSRQVFILFANHVYPRVVARFPFLQMEWDLDFPLSAGDAAADRHGVRAERYTLYRAVR